MVHAVGKQQQILKLKPKEKPRIALQIICKQGFALLPPIGQTGQFKYAVSVFKNVLSLFALIVGWEHPS